MSRQAKVLAAFVKEAWPDPAQRRHEEALLASLLDGQSLEALFAAFLADDAQASLARVERWVEAQVERGDSPAVISPRVHTLIGLVDLTGECAEPLSPNRLRELSLALSPFITRFPRARLQAIPKKKK